jgi:hypothetical protein
MPQTPVNPNMPQTGPGAGYPDASQMPEINGTQDAQMKAIAQGAPHPVVGALATLGKFILDNGGSDPNSPLKMLLQALIEEIQKLGPAAIGAKGGPTPPAGPTPPPTPGTSPGAGAPPANPMDRTIGNFAGGAGGQDMNAGPGAKLFV